MLIIGIVLSWTFDWLSELLYSPPQILDFIWPKLRFRIRGQRSDSEYFTINFISFITDHTHSPSNFEFNDMPWSMLPFKKWKKKVPLNYDSKEGIPNNLSSSYGFKKPKQKLTETPGKIFNNLFNIKSASDLWLPGFPAKILTGFLKIPGNPSQ